MEQNYYSLGQMRYGYELGEEPLLTPEDEITLAQQIALGRSASTLLDENPALDEITIVEQQVLVQQGIEARNRMVMANTRLVASIALKYRTGELEDRMQFGMEGLIVAAEKFDPAYETRFATYAKSWIRQRIQRGIRPDSAPISISPGIFVDLAQIKRFIALFEKEKGTTPSLNDIAKATGLSDVQINARLALQESLNRVSYLDAPIADSDTTLGEALPDPRVDIENTVVESQADILVAVLLDTLEVRDRYIVTSYLGFNGQEMTHEEIAHTLGISRERARQLYNLAIKKLETAAKARHLIIP